MLDQFFSIKNIETQEDGVWAEVELNPSHAVYRGHFPGNPVVPGVCTLMMVKECVEKWKGQRYHYRSLNSCKFLSVVLPDRDRLLKLKFEIREEAGDFCTLTAQMYVGERAVLKLKANLIVG